MTPLPLSVQLYTLREEIKTLGFYPILEKLAKMGFQGVEFAGLHGKDPKEVKQVLDDNGLVASSTHGGFPNKDNIQEQLDLASLFGYTMHISGYGKGQFENKEAVDAIIPQAIEAAKLFEGTGVSLGYHNHWWEFDKSFDGELAEFYFLNRVPGMFAQIDTYWVKVGGADVDVIECGDGHWFLRSCPPSLAQTRDVEMPTEPV